SRSLRTAVRLYALLQGMQHETRMLIGHGGKKTRCFQRVRESGRPGSNRRPSAWEADALPTELRPRLEKGTAPSLQQGIAEKRLQADDLTVRTLLDWHREDGQTMAEYSIILAVITPAIVLAVSLLSDSVATRIGAVASLFP